MTELLKKQIEKASILVFDFDGTLVDSNQIKRKAFTTCLADYPQNREAVAAYCNGNNHVPRVVKFRHVFENILKIPYTPELEKKMLDRYAAETTEQIVAAKTIPGAIPFLDRVVKQKELVLLSSTPHPFLEEIILRRGMKKYFKTVQGAPVDKRAWLLQFIEAKNLKKEEIVFFGDSSEDASAAFGAKVPFIGIGEEYSIASFEALL